MKNIAAFLNNVWRDSSRETWVACGACLLCMAVLAGTLALSACATTPQSLSRERKLYALGTNVVGQVQQAVPYLPVPVSNAAEVALALASAGLAAWNTHQQLALRKLKNGHSSAKHADAPTVARASPAPATYPSASGL